MNRKIKDALTLGIAAAFVLMFALWGICKSDDAVSESERRPLKQFPTLNAEEVLSGRFQSNFETYTLDQFPLRDEFRTLKALSVRDLFGEKDNNGIYVADGYAAKLDDTIHEDSLDHAADRFRYVYETYLKDTGVNVYLSVIPDKNYFLAAENGYPAMDYEKFFALMRQKVDFADYIDLTGTLSLSSYYRTDLHWRQEMLAPTAKALADALLAHGFDLVTGGTDNHLMLADLRKKNITGRELQTKLDEVHITVNKNAIPNDPQKPGVTSGVRIGTPACTTRGFTPEDMPVVADCIDKIATDFDANRESVLAAVAELVKKHPIYD